MTLSNKNRGLHPQGKISQELVNSIIPLEFPDKDNLNPIKCIIYTCLIKPTNTYIIFYVY